MRFSIWNKKDDINGIHAEHYIDNLKIKESDEVILIIISGNKVSYIDKKDDLIQYLGLDINTTVEDVAQAYMIHLKEANNNANEEQITLKEQAYKISNLQAENKELKESQSNQDNEILANMLATTEIFEMVLMMSTPTSFNIENKNKNLGGTSMVEVYVTLILKGAKTIDQVPAIIRDQVQAQLDLLTK